MMDCGGVAKEDMPDATDAPTLTMRPPDDDGDYTSGKEERDSKGKSRSWKVESTSSVEGRPFLGGSVDWPKRTNKLKIERNGVQPQERKWIRVRNTLPKKV
jgi:hypothetical protein